MPAAHISLPPQPRGFGPIATVRIDVDLTAIAIVSRLNDGADRFSALDFRPCSTESIFPGRTLTGQQCGTKVQIGEIRIQRRGPYNPTSLFPPDPTV
jgi:hypothetical protein